MLAMLRSQLRLLRWETGLTVSEGLRGSQRVSEGIRVSGYQGIRVSGYQGIRVSGFGAFGVIFALQKDFDGSVSGDLQPV